MKFCPKCGGLLVREGEYLVCKKCGYKEKIKGNEGSLFTKKESKSLEILVVDNRVDVLPIDDTITCPKCGHKGVYYWSMQTRASDEPETKFFRCPNCGYTWREYD